MQAMEELARQAQADGYVECSECGHALERHIGGCVVIKCGCASWTREQVIRLRRRLGLSARLGAYLGPRSVVAGKWRGRGVV